VPVIGIAWSGDDAAYAAFVDRHGLTFPNAVDDSGDVFAAFGVTGQPAWVFVSSDGSLDVEPGALDADELAARLAALG
jgi:hypothetical protein